ncbi:MAG: hypothetical protein QOE31_1059 [Solirubrobacteraceae bacterium]|jgi:hypothetical protein|nr:hypothetical protein [Solirubrobacteraceae bacterium]
MHRHPPLLDTCSSLARVAASEVVGDAVAAGAAAALLSGVPSTLHAIVTQVDPLEASLAAGTLLLGDERRPSRLLPAALVAHGALSLGWALVLAAALPRRRTAAWAVLGGLAIAALDLGVVGRRFPRIRALALAPQVLDHVAYGATVGCIVSRRRARRS